MPSPAQQKLLAQRDSLLSQADAVRRSDPAMAKHLEDRAGDMDSELEGVDPIQGRDEQGYAQGDNPDYIAFHEAQSRIDGHPTGDAQAQSLAISPGFQAAVSKHLGEQMRQNWMKQMQPQGERSESSGNAPAQTGAALYNNSVTPWAKPKKSAILEFLQRIAAQASDNAPD